METRVTDWRMIASGKRFRIWARRVRVIVPSGMRMLAFVAAVVFLLAMFRQLVGAGLADEVVSVAEIAASVWTDFVRHIATALLMFAVIQPLRHLGPVDGARRVGVMIVAVVLAAALATIENAAWLAWMDGAWPDGWLFALLPFIRFAVLAGMLVAVGEFHRAEVRSLEAMRAAEGDRAALEQETLKARLKTLEAQIEPHFLFNTLANVRRLYETDAVAGDAMLDRLTHYLEVALPSMRGDRATLEREAQLIEAYLDLQRVRMGRRLSYHVDIAPALRLIEVPPMMC